MSLSPSLRECLVSILALIVNPPGLMSGKSDSSGTSKRSLHSGGPAPETSTNTSKACKPAAIWTQAEETALITYLAEHLSKAGDGVNFKTATYNGAVSILKEKFHEQRGGEKTSSTCKTKWNVLKKSYQAVVESKQHQGYMWERYVKSHRTAAPFCNKPFIHFFAIEQMMLSKARGKNVYQPSQPTTLAETTPQGYIEGNSVPRAHRGSSSSLDSEDSTSPPNRGDQNSDGTSSPHTFLPPPSSTTPSIAPSTPSTFLAPSTTGSSSSAMTSVSRGKHKFSTADASTSSIVSTKKSCAPSAWIKVQQSGVEALQGLTGALESFSRTFTITKDPIGLATNRLAELETHLTPRQQVAISDMFAEKPGQASVYLNTKSEEDRKAWVDAQLIECYERLSV
ncbi:hypothetical protein JAAARDRAFT_195937 [Jaapia argillacea MUCL 33604]|uniref:Myb/SANT-like DNA-binding domain-containing protein n=1 Tax=Jaapia argillacea MUCL 33604 TaxID=933084 RepID=A0A067PXI3_9AGAM|nr:hypothetical protein JAAARDRAFT_195937 [Jaapia argillacea MUCL 33604]